MLPAFVVLHVLICFFIIGVVLLQASQQANIGSMFGGGASQTVFGSGTQTALGKATTVAAILFFSTCLLISFVVEKERSVIKRSAVMQEEVKEQTAPKEEGGVASSKDMVPQAGKTAAPQPAEQQQPAPEQ